MLTQNSEYWRNYYTQHQKIRKAQQRAYYQHNRESRLAYSALYNREHKEDKTRYDRVYYQKNKEKRRKQNSLYARTHRAEHNKHSTKYRLKNRENLLNYQHEYYESHKEEKRQYREKNREDIRQTQRIILNRYKSRKNKLEASLTLEQWESIKLAYKGKCAYCGKQTDELTQDHVIPVSLNGPYIVWNIVPACLSCNSRKGNKLLINPPPVRLMV